jgi:hypothetical protein
MDGKVSGKDFSSSFVIFPPDKNYSTNAPMIHAHLSAPLEVYDTPDQATRYQVHGLNTKGFTYFGDDTQGVTE